MTAEQAGPKDLQAILDQHEVEVTRAVTAAVSADLANRHAAELAQARATIAALDVEIAGLHEELHQVRQELHRIRMHPLVRAARAARRLMRQGTS